MSRRAELLKQVLLGPSLITISRVQTWKSYDPRAKWSHLYDYPMIKYSQDQVSRWLNTEYPTCKRVPMYRDKAGQTTQVGYVFGFRVGEPNQRYLQQDWITIDPFVPIARRRNS